MVATVQRLFWEVRILPYLPLWMNYLERKKTINFVHDTEPNSTGGLEWCPSKNNNPENETLTTRLCNNVAGREFKSWYSPVFWLVRLLEPAYSGNVIMLDWCQQMSDVSYLTKEQWNAPCTYIGPALLPHQWSFVWRNDFFCFFPYVIRPFSERVCEFKYLHVDPIHAKVPQFSVEWREKGERIL